MSETTLVAHSDHYTDLTGRGYRPETVRTILEEGLLPLGLVKRLDTLYSQYSALRQTMPPLFTDQENFSGLEGFREACAVLERNGIDIGHQEERELFIDVYRFLATRHTLNSIDWRNFATDSIFQLVFPQPGMIRREVVEAYSNARTREEKEQIATEYMRETNPHDGHQQLNKPWFTTDDGHVEILHGSQHKYPQCQLIFDKQTQHCFTFCTYCFRHAQVRGDEDMFVQEDIDMVHDYLRAHSEVNDLLITGGDAGFLNAERFERYRGWLGHSTVLGVRFEDLVSERRTATVRAVIRFYLERTGSCASADELVERALGGIDSARSHTFREGKVGGWKSRLTLEHRRQMARVAGQLLIDLGYETGLDWVEPQP